MPARGLAARVRGRLTPANAAFEHVALVFTTLAAVGVAITSWSGR